LLVARPRRFCSFFSENRAKKRQKTQFSRRIGGIRAADSAGALKKSNFFNTPNFLNAEKTLHTNITEKRFPHFRRIE